MILFSVFALSVDGFTWQPLPHNQTTSTVAHTKPNVTTSIAPTTTTKFTWGPLHNATTTPKTPVSSTPSNYTFSWPDIHPTTTINKPVDDLIPIIVGAALGGLVIIVLAN